MKHYAGLDVSLKETSVCIVDETGSICREMKTPSHPEDLARVLQDPTWQFARIGLEAGPLSQWLFSGLAEAGLPVVCIETRHTKAFLKALDLHAYGGLGPVELAGGAGERAAVGHCHESLQQLWIEERYAHK